MQGEHQELSPGQHPVNRSPLLRCFVTMVPLLVSMACAPAGRPRVLSGIALEQLDGREVRESHFAGRPLLFYFMTTSCDLCLADMNKLRLLHQRHASRGLQIVVVAMDPDGERLVRLYAEQLQLPFPLVMAGDAVRRGESMLQVVSVVPRVVICDKDLRILMDHAGVMAYADLERGIDRVLRGSGVP